jgi:hypothetical protein
MTTLYRDERGRVRFISNLLPYLPKPANDEGDDPPKSPAGIARVPQIDRAAADAA